MSQSSDPSYLLADFPPTDNPRGEHDKKDARTTGLSVDSDPPGPPVQNGERGFKRKFMPGRLFADCAATIVPIALIAFAIAIMRLDNKETEQEEYRKWRNAINVVSFVNESACPLLIGLPRLHLLSLSPLLPLLGEWSLKLRDGSWRRALHLGFSNN